MIYHTNHCWCSESIYDGKNFDGEVMVVFGGGLSNDFLEDNEIEIDDFDFNRLTEKRKFFDQESWDDRLEFYKERAEKAGKEFKESDHEYAKIADTKDTVFLKQKVVDWLNENIKDKKDTDENTPENERKGWAIGNDKYNSNQSYRINVFFDRQKDALKFIRKWSIYKDPTFYFDYFHDERREMNIKDLINRTNDYLKENNLETIDIGDKINMHHTINTNLNEEDLILIDWETDFDD